MLEFAASQLSSAARVIVRMATELQERRSADPAYDEAEALAWLREWVALEGCTPRSTTGRAIHKRALAALDKLLNRGGR